ncbi:MAG TPA: PAS domain-containing protein [Candidatus Limnocylindrales bacterium]|nr:PAS domain-containing protein [Candidatus Limnocylindrales bacterium]
MSEKERVNILMVDDQPGKLLSYEVILGELDENLIKATSAREALEHLLKTDIAVVLLDVSMPEIDGFELAEMIRQHPRFQSTAILFISAVHLTDLDRLKGYQRGAVDYISVPVNPELLRAKVSVFAELHRKAQQLERLNVELEQRVEERTLELQERRRVLEETQERLVMAQKAAVCGTFDWDVQNDANRWSDDLAELYGFKPGEFPGTHDAWLECVLPEDRDAALAPLRGVAKAENFESEYRIQRRDNGEVRWINARGRVTRDAAGRTVRIVGLNIDTTRMKRAEEELKRAHDELEMRVQARTAELRIAEESLRRLSGWLMRSQDEERRRIARELHDGLGQYLVAVKMSLDVISLTGGSNGRLTECLADASKQIENAISETRTLSHLLHPPLLDEIGLESALVWYSEGFAKRSGIAVDVNISPTVGRLETEAETALFRVVQECLTNIHRHSGSATASVTLADDEGEIRLEVRDEGKGIPPSVTMAADELGTATPGIGLQGIRERVRQLQGRVEIVSNNGRGTAVIVAIPKSFQAKAADDRLRRDTKVSAAKD